MHSAAADAWVWVGGRGVIGTPSVEGHMHVTLYSKAPIGLLVGCLRLKARLMALLPRLRRLPLRLRWAILGLMAMEPTAYNGRAGKSTARTPNVGHNSRHLQPDH